MPVPTTAGATLFIACLAIVCSPLFVLEYPPLLDYPNHLARLHILTHPDDPDIARYWRTDWSLLPNLGFDIIGYGLAQLMPVEAAGKVFLGIAFAVVLGAPLALHRALYGRLSPLPLVAGALLFNRVLQMGFLGYFLGLGLAVWAFAAWIALRRRGLGQRLGLMQAATLALFVCHLYAMAVLAVLVVLSAASGGWRKATGSVARLRSAARAALPESLPFVLPALLLLATRTTGGDGTEIAYEALYLKLVMVPMALMPDLTGLGLVLAEAVLVPPILARLGGGRAMHPAVIWPAVTMLGLYLVMPDRLLSSENADWRLLVPLALVVVGAAEDPFRGLHGRLAVALLALAVNAGAAWNAWSQWRGGEQVLADLQMALAPVERGALLVPWFPGDAEFRNAYRPPSVLHIATLAVIDRAALVPTVFAFEGHQPITLRDPYMESFDFHVWLHTQDGQAPAIDELDVPGRYVLEIRSGRPVPEPVPDLAVEAEAVTRAGHFTLWRVR